MGYVPKPAQAPRLRYIHFNVAGIDHVAHEEVFQDPRITITTSTGAPAIAISEWVFGTLLAHYRQLLIFKEWQNNSTWGRLDASKLPSSLDGKKMGIVGYGSIGRQGMSTDDEPTSILELHAFLMRMFLSGSGCASSGH